MEKYTFDNIVNQQIKITNDNEIIAYYKKICKRLGFLNLKGYDPSESKIQPVSEYKEIRLYESLDGDEFYRDYIKKEELHKDVWYGINGNYLIKNIGNNCHVVYLLS